jgi:hypothetical protein
VQRQPLSQVWPRRWPALRQPPRRAGSARSVCDAGDQKAPGIAAQRSTASGSAWSCRRRSAGGQDDARSTSESDRVHRTQHRTTGQAVGLERRPICGPAVRHLARPPVVTSIDLRSGRRTSSGSACARIFEVGSRG